MFFKALLFSFGLSLCGHLPVYSSLFTNKCTAPCEPICEYNTLKKGVLKVAVSFTNPPFELIQNGKRTGFEVDVINAICKRLKIQPCFVEVDPKQMLSGLEKNYFDVTVGGISITNANKELVSFSYPLMTTKLAILINPMINPEIRSIKDLKGRSIAIQNDSIDYSTLYSMQKNDQVGEIVKFPVNHIDEIAAAIQSGKIDAGIQVLPVAEYLLGKYPNLKIATLAQPQPIAIAFNKHNGGLLSAINQVLKGMKEDGSFETIFQKWFIK